MRFEIGDVFYSKKFILTVECLEKDGMYGINFNARDNSERNYNIVTEQVIEAMVSHKEWVKGEDPWK